MDKVKDFESTKLDCSTRGDVPVVLTGKSTRHTVCWIVQTAHMFTPAGRDTFHNLDDLVSDECLEPARITTQPSENDRTVSSGMHFTVGKTEYLLNMSNDLRQKKCTR